jgi:hypothetical protein
MRRRDFLKYGLGLGVGLVGLGAAGRIASARDAPHDPPPVDDFTYKGHRVQIVMTPMGEAMRLDGRLLPHHVFMQLRRGYASHLLPFADYPARRRLAMDLIDNAGLLFDL